MNELHSNFVNNRVLKLQVGFLLSEAPGQSRDIEFDVPTVRVADDLTLEFLRGKLHLTRNTRGILVQGTLHSQHEMPCSRCLTSITVDLPLEFEELFVAPPEPGELSNLPESGILDLTDLVRDQAFLNMPTAALCKPNCLGLCPECGNNFNEGQCSCADEVIDPRLAKLKALRDQLGKNE